MDVVNELVGLLIVLFIFLFPFVRKLLLRKQKKSEQEEVEVEEEIIEFTPPPLPPAQTFAPKETERTVTRNFKFPTRLEEFESEIDTRKFETHVRPEFKDKVVSEAFDIAPEGTKKEEHPPLEKLLEGKSSLEKMVIFSEVFGKPVSER